LRLADSFGVELEVELGFGLHRHDAARGLRCSGLDPRLDHGELGVGQSVGLGRHLGLFLVRDQQVEPGVIRVAGLDDRARAATLHRSGVAVEHQTAFLLVAVVAGVALRLEDRRDVVLVVGPGFLVGRGGQRNGGEQS
jgi:hypothetical protein